MSVEPLNTIPLQQFLNLVKSADASRQKEIRMDITQARTLALTLGSVMARLEGDLERFVQEQINKIQDEQVITVSLGGSSDWN
jgi:5-bromo-4-chloroindolyl phosphate hydrolysis protein|tara:strand:- start:2023 stop:2271 length:249 start_codon:yes stop_codon:yes gene_type:complete